MAHGKIKREEERGIDTMAYSGVDMADYKITYNHDSEQWHIYNRLTDEHTDCADIEAVLEDIRVDLLDAEHALRKA